MLSLDAYTGHAGPGCCSQGLSGSCRVSGSRVFRSFQSISVVQGLHGAEAILKLRALISNGDFNAYWDYHLAQERHRNHDPRYANGVIPREA